MGNFGVIFGAGCGGGAKCLQTLLFLPLVVPGESPSRASVMLSSLDRVRWARWGLRDCGETMSCLRSRLRKGLSQASHNKPTVVNNSAAHGLGLTALVPTPGASPPPPVPLGEGDVTDMLKMKAEEIILCR